MPWGVARGPRLRDELAVPRQQRSLQRGLLQRRRRGRWRRRQRAGRRAGQRRAQRHAEQHPARAGRRRQIARHGEPATTRCGKRRRRAATHWHAPHRTTTVSDVSSGTATSSSEPQACAPWGGASGQSRRLYPSSGAA
jgi:hypothetical protein